MSTWFRHILKDNSILTQLTPPYTLWMNGVSKRRNHTWLDIVQSMMSFLKLSISLWEYMHEIITCVLNVLPIKSIASTAYEMWKGKKPEFSYFRVCNCLAHIKKYATYKLESRTKFCRFLGDMCKNYNR